MYREHKFEIYVLKLNCMIKLWVEFQQYINNQTPRTIYDLRTSASENFFFQLKRLYLFATVNITKCTNINTEFWT